MSKMNSIILIHILKILNKITDESMARKLKVFLCDLTHDTLLLVSDTIPINIGFIGSYVKYYFDKDIEINLFKYPKDVIEAIKNSPPDLIALSDYSWNSNLSECVAGIAKQYNPNCLTVQGGTNFPHQTNMQLNVLRQHPATDLHTIFEGEVAFYNIIERLIKSENSLKDFFSSPISGSVFIDPTTKNSKVQKLVSTILPVRLKHLDVIPSPYLNGMLDKFFDGRLTPFIETNRGCPFKCSFCHTGADYFQKINNFSIERVNDEISYIGAKIAKTDIVNLHIADTNFGMFPRDKEICEALYKSQQKYGWPLQVMATTGKNNKERVIEITGILGKMFSVNMSVQSMNENVLDNIKRSNIKLDHYVDVNKHLNETGRSTKAELIIGLPGETKDTFIKGVEEVIDSGVSSTTIYTLMLLHGTDFKSPEYREKFGIKGKFRIVPLNFGEYNNEKIFDYEEVCIQNNDMSYEDYIYLRGYALLVEVILNGRPFNEFFRYAEYLGESSTRFLKRLYDNIHTAPLQVKSILKDFENETRGELWDKEEDLIKYYSINKNYKKLLSGEVGGNLIYKYKSRSVAFTTKEWIDYISVQIKQLIKEKVKTKNKINNALVETKSIEQFCRNKMNGLLDNNANTDDILENFDYDIPTWLNAKHNNDISKFKCKKPIKYKFHYTEEQILTRKDNFNRYGSDVTALAKIVTRISNLESLFRKISNVDGSTIEYIDVSSDQFTRYSLSN